MTSNFTNDILNSSNKSNMAGQLADFELTILGHELNIVLDLWVV